MKYHTEGQWVLLSQLWKIISSAGFDPTSSAWEPESKTTMLLRHTIHIWTISRKTSVLLIVHSWIRILVYVVYFLKSFSLILARPPNLLEILVLKTLLWSHWNTHPPNSTHLNSFNITFQIVIYFINVDRISKFLISRDLNPGLSAYMASALAPWPQRIYF